MWAKPKPSMPAPSFLSVILAPRVETNKPRALIAQPVVDGSLIFFFILSMHMVFKKNTSINIIAINEGVY